MLLELKNIQKTYSTKNGVTFRALSNISTSFDGKGLVYLVGASGSGKSTLLNVIGGLDSYDSGTLVLAGRDMKELSAGEVDSLRNKLMGFVFQEFNLIDTLTVFENVKLALDMQSEKNPEKVHDVLRAMGIDDKANNKTKDLSGGQRQRVAIARALVKDPRLILADEPTGSLDSTTSEEVIKILRNLAKDRLVIAVTHDMETAVRTGDRIIEMKDGKIYRDVRRLGEGEEFTASTAEFFSDTLMSVPSGVEVNDADVEKINEAIEGGGRKTYVNFETDPRKVKALFPNLREAVDASRAGEKTQSEQGESEDSALSSSEFVPYRKDSSPMEKVEFKRSRLPLLSTMRLALNNLNFKKFRLGLTVFIAFIAFTFFGVAQSFAAFDVRGAYAATIEREGLSHILVAPSSYYTNATLSTGEISLLKRSSPNVNYFEEYDISFSPIVGSWNTYFSSPFREFAGTIEVDDVTALGYEMLGGISTPTSGAVISEYAARILIRNGNLAASDVRKVVGQTVSCGGGISFVIEGVFACEGIDEIYEKSVSSFNDEYYKAQELLSTGWGQLYVKKGFVKEYGETQMMDNLQARLDISFDSTSDKTASGVGTNVNISFVPSGEQVEKITPIVGDGTIKNPTDIILSEDAFSRLANSGVMPIDSDGGSAVTDALVQRVKELNADPSRKLVLRTATDYYNGDGKAVYVTDKFTVVGITPYTNASYSDMIMHESLFEGIYELVMQPSRLLASFEPRGARSLVNAVYDNGLRLDADFVSSYEIVVSATEVLHGVLMGLSILLCALVVVLLFNFISTSIRLTRKHIGILRALGAKKFDTFKIYVAEGLIATGFSYILSLLVIIIGAPILNGTLTGIFGHYFSLFTIGPVVFLTMAALALIVTVLSVLIPLGKFNRITPVSAISGKE